MKKEEKQYKILPNGKCQLLTGAPKWKTGNALYTQWLKDNPPMPYIPHPEVKENDVVSGEVIPMEQLPNSVEWMPCIIDGNEYICTTGVIHKKFIKLHPIAKEEKTDVDKLYPCTLPLSVSGGCVGTSRHDKCKNCNSRADFIINAIKQPAEKKEEKQNSENVLAYTGKGVGESKYTKGPWRISSSVPSWIVAHDKSQDICKVSDHCGYGDIRGSDLANAFLIAAAPELLEALIELVDVLPSVTPQHQEARYKACIIINKALNNNQQTS